MKKLIMLFLLGLTSFTMSVFAAPVNINTADAKTIADALNGIGLKKAEAIVQYRTEKGPFKAIEELANVPGIGEKTIETIYAALAKIGFTQGQNTVRREKMAIFSGCNSRPAMVCRCRLKSAAWSG